MSIVPNSIRSSPCRWSIRIIFGLGTLMQYAFICPLPKDILLELTEVAFNKLLYEDFEVSIEQIVVRSE